ncbi:MAG: DUF1015 domain-containing protein [Actinomycetota bacterium]|nr:DUF1015 domain-containing protein [Actinomycetota bacterium]
MADVQPLRALHYDLARTGGLQAVTAPPYDVIDPEQRAALLASSPHNVVEVDLPTGEDPYRHAAETFAAWQAEGILVRDPEPALWALEQDYTGPDGRARTRRGFFARVRVEDYGPGRIRPHERTHPGPKEDRLSLTRATRANLSPIFTLYDDPAGAAWSALEPHTARQPFGAVSDPDGTLHRIWRIADPAAIARVHDALAAAELLIADGHHRYETARAYAAEHPGEPDAGWVLMCLVALEDPGLTVFPTHRLVKGRGQAAYERLAAVLRERFDIEETTPEALAPPPGDGPATFGYLDSHIRRPFRLALRNPEAVGGLDGPLARLDTAILEQLLLKGPLGLGDEDISHLHDFGYARDARQAIELVTRGEFDVAFLLRPTPVRQVREIAAAGQSMPPKSTYFFPKVPTGLLFNPLA